MLTYRQIQAFRAVMLSRSFTRAAEMLNVSQPAISRLVRDMEAELKMSLFQRQKGGLLVTEAATALYAEVERSFIGVQKIERAARRISERRGGHLRICGNAAFTLTFLPRVMALFLKAHEGVEVSLHTCLTETAIDLLRTRHFDLAYVMTPADVVGLESGPVRRARCVCLLPPGHALAEQSIVDIEELQDEPFISLSDGTMTRMNVDAAFEAHNVTRRLEIEAEYSASICALVNQGLGASIIEPFTAEAFAEQGGIVRAFRPDIDFTFVQVHRSKDPKSSLINAFAATFESCVTDYVKA